MDALLRDGRAAASRMLNARHLGEADQRALNALLVDVMGLDGMLTHLDYDSRSYSSTVQAREFRARMAMLMPQLISTADSLHRLQREPHGLLPELEEYLQAVDRWIQGDAPSSDADQLRERSLQLGTWLSAAQPTQALAIDSALRQLRALLDLWQDCGAAAAVCRRACRQAPGAALSRQQLAGGRRHHDYGLQGFTAASVALSVFCLSMLWFVSGWQHGYSGVFIAAVAGCFFAGQDNPAPFIRSFLAATLVSISAAGIYLFALMPNVHDFGSPATLLAGPLLLLGTLAGRPQHAGTVIPVAVQTISSITIQSAYRADFQLFADIAPSTALGVVFAPVWARLTRPFGTLWAARRLVRHGWQNLAQLADLSRGANTVASASAFVDRIAQLLPRLTQLGDRAWR